MEQHPFSNSDVYQYRVGYLAANPIDTDVDWSFDVGLTLASLFLHPKCDFCVVGKTALRDIMLELGLCTSRTDFHRRVKAGSVKFGECFADATKISEDIVIDLSMPGVHTIRLGRKCCELIVPLVKEKCEA